MIHKFAILSILFHRNFQKGQKYVHRDYVNSENPFLIEIIEVLPHGIRFKHLTNSIYADNYLEKSAFNFSFQLLKEK